MRRRHYCKSIAGLVAGFPLVAHAQQPAGLRKIAIWMARAEDAEGQRHASAFRQGLQAPTKFTLVVNLKTAKGLDLNVPTSTLLRATEVIE